MKKSVVIILLFNLWIYASAKEDIYRNILYSLYQSELVYRYDLITEKIEEALSEGNVGHKFIVIEDYSKMPDVDTVTEVRDYNIKPYRMYYDTKCNFEDSVGVYVALAKYSSSDKGMNIIKDGHRIWYYTRNIQGQQMASVRKLWQFCCKHNYDTQQMLYMMGAFILAMGDRNTCLFQEFTYDINYVYNYFKIKKNDNCKFLDLLNNTEYPVSDMFLTQPRFAKIQSRQYDDDYLLFYSGDSVYYSPNTIRYQFGFLRKAYMLYLEKAITQNQFINLLQTLVTQK